MSLDDLNREQKRQLRRMGAVDEKGAPTRRPAPGARSRSPSGSGRRSTCARSATRCARWRGRAVPRSLRYSIVVIVTVVVYTALVGGLDYVFGLLLGVVVRMSDMHTTDDTDEPGTPTHRRSTDEVGADRGAPTVEADRR